MVNVLFHVWMSSMMDVKKKIHDGEKLFNELSTWTWIYRTNKGGMERTAAPLEIELRCEDWRNLSVSAEL